MIKKIKYADGSSDVADIALMCPKCHIKAVYDTDTNAKSYNDIEYGDYLECTNCGAEFTADKSNGIVTLLDIEEHEFDNDPIGSGKPTSTAELEDEPAFASEDLANSAILGGPDMKYSTLVDKLTKLTKNFMISQGFASEDVVDYYTVDVSPTTDGRYLAVQVRAELGYADIVELAAELDPIVAEISQDAYFDVDEPGIITAYVPSDLIEASAKVTCETLPNYGGAFDIDPYAFWTKEELVELGEEVAENANSWLYRNGWSNSNDLSFQDAFLEDDYKTITLEFTDDEYDYAISTKIDMRKIRRPSDLSLRYTETFTNKLVNKYEYNHDWNQFSE
jgi:hypothetical protein